MLKNDETIMEGISSLSEVTDIEQFFTWIKANRKLALIGAVMLVHTIIFIGIIAAIATSNSRNAHDSTMNEQIPPPVQPIVELSVEDPISQPATEESVPQPAVEEPYLSISEPADDSLNTAAHDIGVQTGELFNDSRDAVVDFWHGFDDVTGASDWAKALWDSGRERANQWLDENIPLDDHSDSD